MNELPQERHFEILLSLFSFLLGLRMRGPGGARIRDLISAYRFPIESCKNLPLDASHRYRRPLSRGAILHSQAPSRLIPIHSTTDVFSPPLACSLS